MAGVESTLVAVSIARTAKVCGPGPSAAVVNEELQTANAAASTRHSNVPASLEVNENVGVASLVGPFGPAVMVVSGAIVSTLKAREAGVTSTLVAVSIARTSKVCAPLASPVVVNDDVQAANGRPSTRQSKVAPASELNENVGVLSLVGPFGPAVIVVSGAVMSTLKVHVAGEVDRAHLERVRAAAERGGRERGACRRRRRRCRRGTRSVPASVEVNENVGVVSLVGPAGPAVIVVLGATASRS